MSAPIRIPADVDRPDRLLGPFTARQLVILAVTALTLYLVWVATRTLVAAPVFVGCAVPIGTVVTVLVLSTRDGLCLDQLLIAAIVHRLRPQHLSTAPEGIHPVPRWLTRCTRGGKPVVPQPLSASDVHLPESVSAGSTDIGVVDLGADGLAVIAAAGTINLTLRTPAEQDSLVAQLGGWLHSLRQPVQILIRTTRLDLSGHIDALHTRARDMSPELAATAVEHAEHLTDLDRDAQLLRRQVLLVWREPLDVAAIPTTGLGAPTPATMLSRLLAGRRRAQRQLSLAARRAAEARLQRRLNEARELLGPLGITVTALDDIQAAAVLTTATNPARLIPAAADTAAPNAVITADAEIADYLASDADDADDNPHSAARVHGWGGLRRNRSRTSSAAGFVPESLTVGARHVEAGSDYAATLAVIGYPREVAPAWVSPLLSHPGRVDVALHIEPVDPVSAAAGLARQLARLEAARRHSAVEGRLADARVEVAAEDAADLSASIARGEGRLFRVGVYLTVHADSTEELAEEVAAVRTLAASLLIDARPVTYRALGGWVATLPLGLDVVRMRRSFDTTALAAAFPFDSPQLPATDPAALSSPDGVLYGRDAAAGLLFWDRFGEHVDNHNAVVLGRSGSGKSYLVKAEILRSLYRGVETVVIDPEDEYRRLSEAVGGTYIHLGAPGVRLNPFDLEVHTRADGKRSAPADALTRRKLFAHTVFQVLLGAQTPAQRATLDTAVSAAYTAAGVSEDPTTWTRPAPTLAMVREQLLACGSNLGTDLATALAPFTAGGAFAGLFDGPTTTVPDGALVVFSLRELPEELKTVGTLLALDATWRHVANPSTRRPRLVVVDEAWLLMRQPAGAEFLYRAAKSLRKHWAGLTVATQDCADVLSTDLGKAIVANAATQILLHQAPQAITEVAAAFALSDGEQQFLLTAARGHGLLAAGAHRAVFASLASPSEHDLITSDPSELTGSGDDRDIELTDTADTPGEDTDGEDTFVDLGEAP
ncbi:PrgI family mobile element protein [Nocardia vulneris]|uniref:TraG/VirB4 family ATPase n=1 Tax=Nocardia vulneris TaxID=1141657 RepID=UPI0009E41893|nr:PrgI family protein [Nocardia vulneris]